MENENGLTNTGREAQIFFYILLAFSGCYVYYWYWNFYLVPVIEER